MQKKTAYFNKIKGQNFKVADAIWHDNEIGKALKPLSILNKFADNPMKYAQVREQTSIKWQHFDLFKGHNSKVAMRIGCISTWTRMLCFKQFEQVW